MLPRWSSVLIALALATMVIVPLARARPWTERPVAPAMPPPREVAVAVSQSARAIQHMFPATHMTHSCVLELSVLVAPDSLFAGLTVGDRVEIENVAGEYDWDGLESVLRRFARVRRLAGHRVELAAAGDVAFEHVQQAISVAHAAGLSDYRISEPEELSVQFFE